MKCKIDRTSFFKSPSFDSKTAQTAEDCRAQAAWAIQRWWKQLHLKQTAAESFHYVHDLISLQQAQKESFPQLEKFILDPKTQASTHQLLMHLEQTKDIALPNRASLSHVYEAERQFLSAYMIASKSKFLFESPTDIDKLLLSRSEEMLQSFEALCALMSDIYLKEKDSPPSPLAATTPSVDKVFSNLARRRMNHDQLFMSRGKGCLEQFHLKQMAYYETFLEWESKNRDKLANILISKYLEIESKRFTALNSVDPRMLEFYEGYGNQQDTLKKRIFSLLGEEGLHLLSKELDTLQAALEACKWVTSPTESLLHELALDPNLVLPAQACLIRPQLEIDTALAALIEAPPKINLILSLLEDICHHLALFTPNNRQQVTALEQNFSRAAIKTQIDSMGLQQGLYQVIYSFITEIKKLESPAHVQASNLFLDSMKQRFVERGDASTLLKEALDFIYHKMSLINLELKNYQINQARSFIGQNIVAYEQKAFQTRLTDKQFNLEHTFKWLDQIVGSPQSYRLDIPLLCSKHLGTYISHALLIGVLQQAEHAILQTIPETFYLDRVRLVNWHAQYHHLVYTAITLGYFEVFCKKYEIQVNLEALKTEKNRLISLLKAGGLNTQQEKTDDLIDAINRQLASQQKELTLIDKQNITTMIEKNDLGTSDVMTVVNKRLGDELSFYFFKGHLPQQSGPLVKRYGLETELNQLGQEILATLGLHTKVHGELYQHQIELRLWKPLFANLKQTALTEALPQLLSAEKELISSTHHALHKMAFVLMGLALIQQTVVYHDMWNVNANIKNARLKELAHSFGIMDMLKNPAKTKEDIESKLIELMQHVAEEYEIPFEPEDKNKINHMLDFAKTEKSIGYKAFLSELISITKQAVVENKAAKMNPSNLLAEFNAEITQITLNTKEIINRIKKTQLADDADPQAANIPLLRTGRTAGEIKF